MRIVVQVTEGELASTCVGDAEELKNRIVADLGLGDYYYHDEYPEYNVYIELVDDRVL